MLLANLCALDTLLLLCFLKKFVNVDKKNPRYTITDFILHNSVKIKRCTRKLQIEKNAIKQIFYYSYPNPLLCIV